MVHGIVGIALLVFVIMQIGWAIVVRKHVDGSTYLVVHRLLAGGIVMLALVGMILGIMNLQRQRETVV